MNKTQSGFTLIELVAVIAILGILAATALPRFASLDTEAKAAAKKGVIGGLNSAIAMVHSKWLAVGTAPATVTLDGGVTVSVNASGYPDISATGAYKDAATCGTLISNMLGSSSGLVAGFVTPNCTVDGTSSYGTVITLTSTSAS